MGIAEDTVKHWFVEIFDKTGTCRRYPTSSPQPSSVFFTNAMN